MSVCACVRARVCVHVSLVCYTIQKRNSRWGVFHPRRPASDGGRVARNACGASRRRQWETSFV